MARSPTPSPIGQRDRDREADAAADELLKIMRLAFHAGTGEAEAIAAFLTARRKLGSVDLLSAFYQLLEYDNYLFQKS